MKTLSIKFSLLIFTVSATALGSNNQNNKSSASSLSKVENYNIFSSKIGEDKKNNLPLTLNTALQRREDMVTLLAMEPLTENDKMFDSQININCKKYLAKLNRYQVKIINKYVAIQKRMTLCKDNHSLASILLTYAHSNKALHGLPVKIMNLTALSTENDIKVEQKEISSLITNTTLLTEMQTVVDDKTHSAKKISMQEEITKQIKEESQKEKTRDVIIALILNTALQEISPYIQSFEEKIKNEILKGEKSQNRNIASTFERGLEKLYTKEFKELISKPFPSEEIREKLIESLNTRLKK